ncbi:hypothetical protein D3C85_1470840 [compost metagenome]
MLTPIVNVTADPAQPFKVGTTVIVPLIGVVPEFVPLKAAILPVPLAPSPIEVLLFVHAYVAPVGVEAKDGIATLSFGQTTTFATGSITGIGLTVMIIDPVKVLLQDAGAAD